jgi:hypothetical protein
MTGDFASALAGDEGDHELIAVDAHPNPFADQLVRHRIARRAETQRRVVIDHPGDTKGDRVRLGRDRVQPPAFGRQPIGRGLSCLAMRSCVDQLAERVAGGPQLGERAV